jgi:hypothetical protein
MPTRYALELDSLKGLLSNDTFKEVRRRHVDPNGLAV